VSFFRPLGVEPTPVVGMEAGAGEARQVRPDLVLCDYDLVTASSLAPWKRGPDLADIPIVAVSLTRRPSEAPMADASDVAGFLHLPTLTAEEARCLLAAG
jgi:hypothetical protein